MIKITLVVFILASLIKIASNQQVRKIAAASAKMAVQAIKTRRTNRIRAGRRVAGQRTRDWMLRRGVPLPIPPARSQVSVPVRRNVVIRGNGEKPSPVLTGTDTAFPITNLVDTPTSATIQVPLIPTDLNMFPKLATKVGPYQYYKWNAVCIDFQPAQGTSVAGNIAFAVVPSFHQFSTIQSFSDLTAIETVCQGPINSVLSRWYNGKSFDTSRNKYVIQSAENVDVEDNDSVAGYLVVMADNVTVDGAALPAGSPIGKFTLTYSINVYTEVIPDASSIAPSVGSYYNAAPDATILTEWLAQQKLRSDRPTPYISITDDAGVLTYKFGVRGMYVFRTLITTSNASTPTLTVAAVAGTGATVKLKKDYPFGTLGGARYYVVLADRPGASATLTQTVGTATSVIVDVTHVPHAFTSDIEEQYSFN